eukprot:CAMPEP_0194276274 /NCGR_PEP_ID=MMETSP0169-20130528/8906_1 /TAXON_ID=218684 /ORGANISM="Corethron pennatum, Strain L29A3" /LENGTH=579 /DNA_ID=CAMNT_0039019955 /DNA_START=9 /DNA_END=1746 /DNA_ORIENTATION=-
MKLPNFFRVFHSDDDDSYFCAPLNGTPSLDSSHASTSVVSRDSFDSSGSPTRKLGRRGFFQRAASPPSAEGCACCGKILVSGGKKVLVSRLHALKKKQLGVARRSDGHILREEARRRALIQKFKVAIHSEVEEAERRNRREEEVCRDAYLRDPTLVKLAGLLLRTQQYRYSAVPAELARQIDDFLYARELRIQAYGDGARYFGVFGLYQHINHLRIDIFWAEKTAWWQLNGEDHIPWSDYDDMMSLGFYTPLFTYLLLLVCTVMMVLSFRANGWVVEPFSENPTIGPSLETLTALGAKNTDLVVNGGEYWRLFTSNFLHAASSTFFLNMTSLWYVGRAVERYHGTLAALLIFCVSSVGGTILSALFLPRYISIGASGGIFGLMGSCLSDILQNRQLLFTEKINGAHRRDHKNMMLWLTGDVFTQCFIGFLPLVDNFTHLGGLMFGFLCGIVSMKPMRMVLITRDENRAVSPKFLNKQRRLTSWSALAIVLALAASAAALFRGDGSTSPCERCSELSCVAFPPWAGKYEKWWYCDRCGESYGDATYNAETGEYKALSLTCPIDYSVVDIELDGATDENHW